MSTIRVTSNVQNIGAGNQFLVGTTNRQNPYQVANDSRLASDAIQVLGTSAAQITVGGVDDAAYILIENQSADNTLEYGYDDTGFVKLGEIPPGHPPLQLPVSDPADIWLRGSAAGTNARVVAIKFVAPS